MSAQRSEYLSQAIALSRRMAACGEAGDWQQVIELEAQRSHVLAQAFEVAEAVDVATSAQISEILAVDKQLLQLGVVAQGEAAAELAQMQRGRKVTQAYGNASV